MTQDAVENIPSLNSNQEEADARLVLYTIEATQSGADKVVAASTDTDVLVLLIHHRTEILVSSIYI